MDYSTLPGGFEPQPSTAEHLLASDTRAEISDVRIGVISGMVMARVRAGYNGKGGIHSRERLRRWAAYSIAAAAVVVITAITALRLNTHTTPTYRTVVTLTGERATVKLTDGSSIILGPQSQLRYSSDFGKNTRDLILEGQALFTVVNNSGAPLTVRAGSTTTRVLGTTFSVRKYADESSVRVAVAQGKVGFESVVLGTGDIGVLNSNAPVEVKRDVNVAAMLAWADGKLVFDNTPMREVIPELERWYGIKVSTTSPQMLNEPLVLTLSTETSSDALRLIARALGVTYTLNGRQAVIGKQR